MTKDVKDFFDVYAEGFDAIYGTKNTILERVINKCFRKSMKLRFEKVMRDCDPVAGKTVLDVGCGPGLYSVTLAKRGAAMVMGIDFSESMIDIARAKAKAAGLQDKCEFIAADFMSFSPGKKFNYAVVMGVMDYIPNPVEFIRKLVAVTEEKIFLSFPEDKGILAMQRKRRYKKRCRLYMVTEESLKKILDQCAGHDYNIEKISRDYFVTINSAAGLK